MTRSLLTEELKQNKIEREMKKIYNRIKNLREELTSIQRSISKGYLGNINRPNNMNNTGKKIRIIEKKIGSLRKSLSNSNISKTKKIKR